LIRAGGLPVIPIDPFTDEPLKYSCRREVIWSVGSDGQDDGGDGVAQYPGGWGKDIVWKLSTAARLEPD
jgi:hypothetical protein